MEKLIDERNDVDRIRQDEEEYEEEQAKKAEEQAQEQGELLQPEEPERGSLCPSFIA